jgi:hypothetical protein
MHILCVHVCVYACMCVCMYVFIHVCVYAYMLCCRVCVYVSMHVCMCCCACVYASMHVCILNTQLNRWSGKQGKLVQHYVKVVSGMLRWISSVLFVGLVCSVRYVSLRCKRRDQDATFFCCVAYARTCIICENWSKNYCQILLSGAQEQKL